MTYSDLAKKFVAQVPRDVNDNLLKYFEEYFYKKEISEVIDNKLSHIRHQFDYIPSETNENLNDFSKNTSEIHTCSGESYFTSKDFSQICPGCFQFKFSGAPSQIGYNKYEKFYDYNFDIELSKHMFNILIQEKASFKLMCTRNTPSFQLIDKELNFWKKNISTKHDHQKRIRVKFSSLHQQK